MVVTGTLKDFDITSKLKDINVPTLVLCGDRDASSPITSQRIAGQIPGSQFKLIHDSAHYIYLEQPAQVSEGRDPFCGA